MFTQRAVIDQLKHYVKDVKDLGLHLNKVVLFGSYSRNEQHEWSDVDIALVADEFSGDGFSDVGLFSKVNIKYADLNLQPRTYNTKDFTPKKDPFVEEILRTGIEIKA